MTKIDLIAIIEYLTECDYHAFEFKYGGNRVISFDYKKYKFQFELHGGRLIADVRDEAIWPPVRCLHMVANLSNPTSLDDIKESILPYINMPRVRTND